MSHLLHRRQALAFLCGYPVAVTGLRHLQGESPLPERSRRIIISSDDAGMCKAVNEGTIQGLKNGIVTSVSIMTCCPEYHDFAKFAVEHPEFDYGVHLVLTCDLRAQPWGPVQGPQNVPSLVGDDGYFQFWPDPLVDYKEVKLELVAQIELALKSGIRISHLDHHMWVMFRSPELLRLYVELGLEYNLPVRICHTPPKRIAESPELLETYQDQLQLLDTHGLPILEMIESDNYSIEPQNKRGYFLEQLRNLPQGVSEFSIHCSMRHGRFNPPDVEKRLADLEFFTSREAQQECDWSRIKQVNWRNI